MKIYNWNAVQHEQLNPGLARRVIHGANMTVARIELRKAAVVPEHSHVNEQVCLVERGVLRFYNSAWEQVVRAGEALVIPPNAPHAVEAIEDSAVVDIFSPAREDWIRGDDAYLRR
jgi:quercetin dioxygenase-like cupin family protein